MARALLRILALGGAAAALGLAPGCARVPRFVATRLSSAATEYGASGTSFYTTTEKQETYESLDKVLGENVADVRVRGVIVDLLDACAEITEALRSALVTVEGPAAASARRDRASGGVARGPCDTRPRRRVGRRTSSATRS